MCGTNAREQRNALVRFVSITQCHSSSVNSVTGLRRFTPALLIRICTLPADSATRPSSRATSSSFVTSQGKMVAPGSALPRCLVQLLHVPPHQRHADAGAGQCNRHGAAQAARGSGDEGHLALQEIQTCVYALPSFLDAFRMWSATFCGPSMSARTMRPVSPAVSRDQMCQCPTCAAPAISPRGHPAACAVPAPASSG